VGLRFHPVRGSMDLGASDGGLPPDELVETTDAALAASAAALDAWHDPAPGAMVRVGVGPCSPFSVSETLVRGAAELVRSRGEPGVRLHTHLLETADEAERCLAVHGAPPVDWLERLGWVGDDVWLAHCVHLSAADIARFAAAGVGVAHCPTSNLRLGSGFAPAPELVAAGASVGLGVDGSASNDGGDLLAEARQALLVARGRLGAGAMDARGALRLATRGGAAVLGRDDLGQLTPGMRADLSLFRVDTLAFAGAADPVAALVLCAPQRAWHVLVEGRTVVASAQLATLDEHRVTADARKASAVLLNAARVL
jgi:cytosine/adenosine deaminase-related metal-dependent hydrolase